MQQTGTFFVIEGSDGSGKATQLKLLANRLEAAGYEVATFDFPRYDQPSSYFVKEYLNGKYGDIDKLNPYTKSLFYALDRFAATTEIRQALVDGKIVLSNRFTGSNMAHQGSNFKYPEERRGFFIWLDNLEFELLKIPRPTRSFVLHVPAETGQKLVEQKSTRKYTAQKLDLHESDLTHLQKSVEVYDDLCKLFPKDFQRIDCFRSGQLMTKDAINDLLWQTIEPLLPPQKSQPKPEPNKEIPQLKPVSKLSDFKPPKMDNHLLSKILPENFGQQDKIVQLISVEPRMEFDLLSSILYQHSQLSYSEIQTEIDKLKYSQKADLLKINPDILEQLSYTFDVLCDFGIIYELKNTGLTTAIDIQPLTPRYGYEVPRSIEADGLADEFENAFDQSLQNNSQLFSQGKFVEAQQATLLGHKQRARLTINAKGLKALQSKTEAYPGTQKIVEKLVELASEVHPIIWSN